MSRVLITGGAGFIGSHLCLQMLSAGHSLVVLDDFSNSSPVALQRVAVLAGLHQLRPDGPGIWRDCQPARLELRHGDVRCRADLLQACQNIDAVMHLAGLKSVGESVHDPLRYWDINVHGTMQLLQVMNEFACRTIVFSSSASIYGLQEHVPIAESATINPINPYASTKATVEQLLSDLVGSGCGWRVACLRYFNTVGAHPSGQIGEAPLSVPSNLFPLIIQVASGRRGSLHIYGQDWPTKDGTCIRDYIHVLDLADGHIAALHHLLNNGSQFLRFNLGSGHGHSVLDAIETFNAVSGISIPWTVTERRPGDAAVSVADVRLAEQVLGWTASRSLQDMCKDSWAWLCSNPSGYTDESHNAE
ncbi:MAG: UDP-glucose 4-epimerase GalE [Synechococcaceae cyanobacterium]|jgi:UDP-glucose 4-epimerase